MVCALPGSLGIFEDRGAPVANGRFALAGTTPMAAALRPDGRGLVALVRAEPPEPGGTRIAWVDLPEGSAPGAAQWIEGSDAGSGGAQIACVKDAGIVVVLFFNVEHGREMLALSLAGNVRDEDPRRSRERSRLSGGRRPAASWGCCSRTWAPTVSCCSSGARAAR